MIEHLFIASAWCFGIYAIFDSKHLLGRLGGWLQSRLGATVCRPLFLCPTCQASVHGIPAAIYLYGFSLQSVWFVIALAGLNYIIITILPEYE